MPSLRCLRAGSKKGVNWSEKESWKHPGFYARFFHFTATQGHSELNPARFLQTTPSSAGASEESSLPQKTLGRRGSEIQESTRAWSPHLRPFWVHAGTGFPTAAGPSGSGWLENSWLKLILSPPPPILTRQFFLSVVAEWAARAVAWRVSGGTIETWSSACPVRHLPRVSVPTSFSVASDGVRSTGFWGDLKIKKSTRDKDTP